MTAVTHDLVERYLWAVRQRLPEAMRDDVTAELRGTISEMVDARTDMGADAAQATSEVLLDLGEPAALARAYAGDRRYLIGPAVYDEYRRVVLAILVTVLPLVLVALGVVNIAVEDEALLPGLLHAVVSTAMVAVHIVFWTTVAFAVAERSGFDPAGGADPDGWHPDQLPAVPPQRQIVLAETVWGIGVAGALVGWLVWQQVGGVVDDAQGDPVPVLEPALWAGWLPVLIALMVAEVVLEVVKHRVGRWTASLTLANVALNALLAAYFVALFALTDVFNPEFGDAVASDAGVWDPQVVGTVVLVSVLVICVWDSVDSVRKHLQLRAAA